MNTGSRAAAITEPRETIRKISTVTIKKPRQISATRQSKISIMPRVVSTPLPPRKPKYKGKR